MKKRLIIFLFLLPILQILGSGLIYDYMNMKYPLARRNLNWGLSVYYFGRFYIIVIYLINILIFLIKNAKVKYALFIVFLCLFDLFLFPSWSSYPYRVPFILALTNGFALISIITDVFIREKVTTQDNDILDENH